MSGDLTPWVSDVLVAFGVLIVSIGILGVLRMPDVYTKVHVASKAVFLGAFPVLVAAALAGDRLMLSRAVLIALFLAITSAISAHAIGHAAYLAEEKMESPNHVDESRGTDPSA